MFGVLSDSFAWGLFSRRVCGGKIDVVVVYKLDRISRSFRDFTELDGIFSRHGASMVSVTQQIDTSTSMGRMIVNLLMSFAQFEREMTSDYRASLNTSSDTANRCF